MSTRAAAARRQERQLAATSDSTARVRFEPRSLRQLHPAEYLLRFTFGAGVSVVAGLILLKFGPRLGGVFLAFPAILPASLTLLDQRHGNRPARADAVGAALGAVALIAFALAAYLALGHGLGLLSLAAALAAWLLVALTLFRVSRGHPG